MITGASQVSQNQASAATTTQQQQQQQGAKTITTCKPSPAIATVSKQPAPVAIDTTAIVKQLHSEVISHVAQSQSSSSPQTLSSSAPPAGDNEVVQASKRVAALYMSEKLDDNAEKEPDETVQERVTLKDWDPVSYMCVL